VLSGIYYLGSALEVEYEAGKVRERKYDREQRDATVVVMPALAT
jgi:hypothetical protein